MSRVAQLLSIATAVAVSVLVLSIPLRGQPPASLEPQVDRVFARWTTQTPGCAVGVSVGDTPVLRKAYGMADLEHDVANTPDTIFEAGSVSKQFTAAAVLLLAREGKLSLEDQVRKYIPELPDYGQSLTIRHMLNHSSGLRDWGSVAGIGGWPRSTRAYTHAHVLDIVARQRSLNFPPGTRYSYSNTGYNLSAILVSRVSGMPFADFTRQRLFEPLGMTRTSWRDDYRRVVKGRAIAYDGEAPNFRTLMPFENVHGNGGLLTTVGDLLKWNANFAAHVVGDNAFTEEMERAGRFTDGRAHGYALGLMVAPYKGVKQVAHSGSTAGYRAHLNRFPDAGVSVAVLCNASSGAATEYANAVADLYLGDRIKVSTPAATHTLTPADADAVRGVYRHTGTGEPLSIVRTGGGLRLMPGAALFATAATRFVTAAGDVLDISGTSATITDIYGRVDAYAKETAATPTPEQLRGLAGTYVSEDAETTLVARVDGTELVLARRPDAVIRLTPVYPDGFTSSLGAIVFRREGGKVTALSVVQDRVWDMRFVRR